MRFIRPFYFLALLVCFIAPPLAAQSGDSDGDGIADDLDLCFREAGTVELYGCTPEAFALFGDTDGDGVIDVIDACFDRAGDAANSGCPADVQPDLDYDGVIDSIDACPRQFGASTTSGCPADADGDGTPDVTDACPTTAGTIAFVGCAEAGQIPDADGDTVTDIFDSCPESAGAADLGGCPDGDGDTLPDAYDICPDEAGDTLLIGCPQILTATLPAARAPLTLVNAGGVGQVAQIAVGVPVIDVSAGGMLLVRASEQLYTYDLNAPELAPIAQIDAGPGGYPAAIRADGAQARVVYFPEDFSAPPGVRTIDIATGAILEDAPASTDPAAPIISGVAYSPALDRPFSVSTNNGTSGFTEQPTNMSIVGEGGALTIAMPDSVINVAISGDGVRLAADSAENGQMFVRVFETNMGMVHTTLTTLPTLHFMGTPMALNKDGSRLAVGTPEAAFGVYDLSTAAPALPPVPIFNELLFDASIGEVVSAVAYSPDGSLIAVAGGVPFSGGLSGNEVFPVLLLDANNGAVLVRLEGHGSLVRDLLFSPDGTLLVTAADSTVRFWAAR